MRVAINVRHWISSTLDGYGNFIKACVERWVVQYPNHEFVLITDRKFDYHNTLPKTVRVVVAGPQARLPILWWWWYQIQIPRVLKRIKADVFISMDGMCSTRTALPQVCVIHDLAYKQLPKMFPKPHVSFLNRYDKKMANAAAAIATVSSYSKSDIVKFLQQPFDKIQVVFSGVKNSYKPLVADAIQAIRNKYTEGLPYFIQVGAITPRKNTIALLKAFSIFKERQQSNIKLILVGKVPNSNSGFLKLLATYKYRADVVLLQEVNDNELTQLVGGAFALVYNSLYEGFGVPPLEAMQAKVPAIVSGITAMPEICGEAACFIDPNDINSIYEGLKYVYADDDYRAELIQKGQEWVKQYNWDNTADLLWQAVMGVVAK
jgi:glycosyltransferase involved in cell wall biosynthesis